MATSAVQRHYSHHNGGNFWFGLGFGVLTAAIISSIHNAPPPRGKVYYEQQSVVVSRPSVVYSTRYGTPLKSTYGQVIVTAAELNVRSGPAPDRAVIGQVRKGDVLAVIDSIPSWFYVRQPNGRYGWVMDQYTRSAQPVG